MSSKHILHRLFMAAALVAVSQLAILGICGSANPGPAHLPTVGPETLPADIGDFVGRDEPVDVRTLSVARVDAMINRVYRNRLGDNVAVNLGIWTQYESAIPHAPSLCYPAAGWELVNRNLVTVPLEGKASITVRQFRFQRDSNQIAVAFWVQLGDKIVTDDEGIRAMRQDARKKGAAMPALVKVMLHTEARDVSVAEARLARFIAAIASQSMLVH